MLNPILFRSLRTLCLYSAVGLALLVSGCNFDGAFGTGSDSSSSSSSSGSSGGSSSSSSSSGGGTGVETEGVFNGGQIAGLYFETPSFSGLTDADGTFRFRDGEEVRFSLGGIVLGSARGAPEMNLFTLVGSAPIVEEAQIRAALEDRQRIDDFDRVANMALLLVTLDTDQDPTNGVDLSGWDSALADYQVDFRYDFYEFPERRGLDALRAIRTAFDIRYQVAPATPLVFLYDALGIAIPAHVPVREIIDEGNDGIAEFEIKTTYNSLGLPEEIHEFPRSGTAETWNQWLRYTYEDDGRTLVIERERDDDGGGVVDSFTRRNLSYDENGLLTAARTESGRTFVESRSDTLYQHDSGGNLTLYRFQRDEDLDRIADDKFEVISQYNGNGLLRVSEQETDADNDGGVERRERFEYSYIDGLLSRVLQTLDEEEPRANGVIDAAVEILYQYDSDARLTEQEQKIDGDGNGITDSIYTVRWSYNDSGQLQKETRATDSDADSFDESRQTLEYSYDGMGNIIQLEVRFDENADGTTDSITITDYGYNAIGQLTLIENFTRIPGGVRERKSRERRTYGDNGELLTRLQETFSGSIFADDEIEQRWTYGAISDGLYFLVDYFRRNPGLRLIGIDDCLKLRGFEGGAVCERPFVSPENPPLQANN